MVMVDSTQNTPKHAHGNMQPQVSTNLYNNELPQSAHYFSQFSPSSSFQDLDGGMPSPEPMVTTSESERNSESTLRNEKGKGKIAKPTTSSNQGQGISRRHTVSSIGRPKTPTSRKRTYLQSCDFDNDAKFSQQSYFLNSRRKVARKFSHPAEVHRPKQRVELLDLPAELLASVIILIIESPPPGKDVHFSRNGNYQMPVRRWTIENTPSFQRDGTVDFDAVFDPEPERRWSYHDEIQHRDEAFYPSRMLNSIASTCHRLRKLVRLKEWDVHFWRPAARLYYHLTYYPQVLPDSLDLIQGSLLKNQTSWRNFLTCTVQYVDTRRRGVESFGTKAGCKPAISWKDYQEALRQNRGSSLHSRRLMMLCRQPGPDVFDTNWDSSTQSYTISMGLKGGKCYASVDQKGNFTRGEELSPHLARSFRGLFPADILEVQGDRFSIVRIGTKGALASKVHPLLVSAPIPSNFSFQEVIRWDLSCVPDVLRDEKARIAMCASWGPYLCFTLFKQNLADPTDAFLDPLEDSTVYCIKSIETAGQSSSSANCPRKLKSELVWLHNFSWSPEESDQEGKRTEPAVCHIELSPSYAAVLLRWNTASVIPHVVDEKRQLYVISLNDGKHARRFNLPEFAWDFRHNDMGDEYNQIRLDKLRSLYDDRHALHRATRVHDDKIIILESQIDGNIPGQPPAKIITGSHDYCNWVWDLNQLDDNKPLLVLDDFYWEEDTNKQQQETKKSKNKWNRFKERAGWWCSTPNQVLDFWHDFSITPDGRFFAAIRAGRVFIWDIAEERPTIKGYTCELDDEEPLTPSTAATARRRVNTDQSLERYLGRPTEYCDDLHGHSFLRWFEYKNRIPEQGLWMVFDDWSVVYLDRNDILGACGLPHREWIFSEDDFESINSNTSMPQPTLKSTSPSSSDTDMDEEIVSYSDQLMLEC
ncbi:hypothetical protein ABW19_dt0207938 [Dactylella cylindrospora]|nr:hypothetical protein ABW19_dt0207938 [Dactylella cylindrospora]